MHDIDLSLVDPIDLLCLDAGNTIIFLDHRRLAASCARAGFATSPEVLVRTEGYAKVALESGEALDVGWATPVFGSRNWGLVVGTMLARAGLATERVPELLEALWSVHRETNFWSLVPDGLAEGLARVRAMGVRVAVVSNAEGTLESVLDAAGVLPSFDLVLDSCLVGFEKPDPRIFQVALDRFGVPAARSLHLGDTYATDVIGARAAGIRVALIDPHGHFLGRHPDVARVRGVAEVAGAIARARRSGS